MFRAIIRVMLVALSCGIPAAIVSAQGAPREDSLGARLGAAGERLFHGDLFSLGTESEDTTDKIYRYRENGRTVYTNIIDQVPMAQRADAEMDLSHVSLNSELGREIEDRLEREHRRLRESDYCRDLRDEIDKNYIARMWDRYAVLIVCGGLLLLLIAFTPYALRRINAPDWSRTLSMAIPLIAFVAVAGFTMVSGSRTVVDLKRQFTPCQRTTWTALSKQDDAITRHADLVRTLKAVVSGHVANLDEVLANE